MFGDIGLREWARKEYLDNREANEKGPSWNLVEDTTYY